MRRPEPILNIGGEKEPRASAASSGSVIMSESRAELAQACHQFHVYLYARVKQPSIRKSAMKQDGRHSILLLCNKRVLYRGAF